MGKYGTCHVAAIDGKHTAAKSLISSGSLYFNYRGFFSIVLMAIRDTCYIFMLVDIGSYGSNNDSGVFSNSTMGKWFFENHINLPDPEVISNDCSRKELPYYLVGDEAFSLKLDAFTTLSWKKHFWRRCNI